MTCPKCGNENVSIQVVNEATLKTKHHSFLWWLFIGWWWKMLMWLFLTIPMLIIKIFSRKKQKVVNKQSTVAVCQSCGYRWTVA